MSKAKPTHRGIIIPSSRLASLNDGSMREYRVPVRKQPPHSCRYVMNANQTHALCFGPNGECVPPTGTSKDHRLPSPYKPGEIVYVKQAFFYTGDLNDFTSVRWVMANEADDPKLTARCMKKAPSSRMPYWMARHWLRIDSVRVQRVGEITHYDALAEGVPYNVSLPDGAPTERFVTDWDSRHKSHPFESNPWCWVYEISKVERP